MTELSIDIETYSSNDLKTAGLYKYIEAPDFEVILFSWAFDDNEPQVVNSIDEVPSEVIEALTDPNIEKTAFNAAFEIACLQVALNKKLDPNQWTCTMVLATMLGLPSSLDMAGRALNLDTTKDAAGKALIKFFCIPCKPTKTNGMRTRNMSYHDIMKWFDFGNYCCTDVVQERKIKRLLKFFKISAEEKALWLLDQKINARGIAVDMDLVNGALDISTRHKENCISRAIQLTGLDNPGSVAQIKGWLEASIDEPIDSLAAKKLPALKKRLSTDKEREVLSLREELSKTSVKKYLALYRALCDDGRVKGLLQYYGASKTGRWAGRLIQPHNLPRNTMKQLDMAREIVKTGDLDALSLLWKSPPDVLSQLIRTALVSSKGKSLIPSDFSAIEARVTAWLAGEAWRLNVFNTHGRIYEASASTMFKVPIETISYVDDLGETIKGPNYKLRQNGKVSELALGFGGGPNALIKMGALEMDFMIEFMQKRGNEWDKGRVNEYGPTEHKVHNAGYETVATKLYKDKDDYVTKCVMKELAKLVKMWRNNSPKIVKYWRDVELCAIEAVQNPGSIIKHNKGVTFQVKNDILWLTLPGGRPLVYRNPVLKDGKFEGTKALTYLGVNQITRRWERMDTYGGKLTENIVQAIARDLLALAMLRLDKNGFDIVMHVHDEVILEVPEQFAESSIKLINKTMAERPSWADGLPLGAESFITKYYMKE